MRAYARNSPQAVARIVALAMLADGHVDRAELGVLDRSLAAHDLGVERREWDQVVEALCADLIASGELCWQRACSVSPGTLTALLEEIDDPELCLSVVRVCASLLDADRHVSEGETVVLSATIARWRELRARGARGAGVRTRAPAAAQPA